MQIYFFLHLFRLKFKKRMSLTICIKEPLKWISTWNKNLSKYFPVIMCRSTSMINSCWGSRRGQSWRSYIQVRKIFAQPLHHLRSKQTKTIFSICSTVKIISIKIKYSDDFKKKIITSKRAIIPIILFCYIFKNLYLYIYLYFYT